MKKYLLLLFALAMVLGLAACEKDPTTAPTAATQPTTPTTLPTTAPTTAPTVPTTAPTEPVHVHTAEIWQMDKDQHWQQCAECGELLNEGPHMLEDGFCTQCDAEIFQSNFDNTTCVFLYDEYDNMTMNQEYDENGTLLRIFTWQYTYDDAGNMLTSLEYEDNFLALRTSYELDDKGESFIAMETSYYADKTKETTYYDQWGNVTRYVHFGETGLYTLHLSYEYTYDDAGNILHQKTYDNYVLISESEFKIFESEFGDYSYPVKEIMYFRDGSYCVTLYDDNHKVIEEAYYDADGNRIDTSDKFDPTICAPLFGIWEGEVLLDGDAMGMVGIEGMEGFRLQVFVRLTFRSDGTAQFSFAVDPDSLLNFMVECFYVTYETEFGLSREEADAQFQQEMGMTVHEYVQMMLSSGALDEQFNQKQELVYYVEDGQIFASTSWTTKMDPLPYTLEADTLTLQETVADTTFKMVLTKAGDIVDSSEFFDAEACSPLFGSWSGEAVLPTVQTDLPIDVRCQIMIHFNQAGQMYATITLNREDVKVATIEKLYQTFEATGMTREDVDAAFMENAGTTIGEAVDAMLDSGASEVQLEQSYTGVYYVADGMIYGGERWEDEMEPIAFTLDGDTLTLMSEGEEPVTLTRNEN